MLIVEPLVSSWTETTWNVTDSALRNYNMPSQFNVDGTRNEAGSITEIVDTILWYNGHMERTSFTITNLRKQDLILRFTWLQEHNLELTGKLGK